jgi:hypothetical protein
MKHYLILALVFLCILISCINIKSTNKFVKIEKRFCKKVFKNNFDVFYSESTVKGVKKEILCSGKFVTNSMYVYYLNDNSFLKDIDSNFLNVNSIVFSKKK